MATSTVDLREQRRNIWEKAQEILSRADDQGNLSAEDNAAFDAAEADIKRLTENIERIERADSYQRSVEERVGDPAASGTPAGAETRTDVAPVDQEQYREAFNQYLRHGFAALEVDQRKLLRNGFTNEVRAQGVGTDAGGGYTVPTGFQRELIQAMKAFGGVRRVARVITTDSGNDIEWPTVDETSQEGELLAENTPAAEQDVTFAGKTLKAYKYSSKIIRVSLELLQDSAFDLDAFLREVCAERIARITNRHFTTGTGTNQPQGVVTYSSLGATAAAAGAVAYDDLVSLEHSIDPAYRESGSCAFMFADTALAAAKKLKDANGLPLWVPGMATNSPDTILGYPYVINQNMATVATGEKSVLFGDFKHYIIRDVANSAVMLRLTERYAEYGQVAFLLFERHDGRGVGAEASSAAIKHLLQP